MTVVQGSRRRKSVKHFNAFLTIPIFREDIKKDDAAASARRAQEDGYKMSTG